MHTERAIKWILHEQNLSYSGNDYLIKLKSLQILPLDIKLLYTDLILFHRIIHRNICIDLPDTFS